jgi:hypothetical protein
MILRILYVPFQVMCCLTATIPYSYATYHTILHLLGPNSNPHFPALQLFLLPQFLLFSPLVKLGGCASVSAERWHNDPKLQISHTVRA